jgi:glucokinase
VSGWRLVGDVGGSNARFARVSGGALRDRRSFSVRDYPSFYDALGRYLAETGGTEGCNSAAVGVAGPVDAGRVKLTNAAWIIDAKETAARLGGASTAVVNDLQAVALSLPHLSEQDLTPLGAAVRASGDRRTMLALNVGTGFGAAALVPAGGGRWVPSGGEPGHMAIGAIDAEQLSIIEGIPTVEDLLSGRGVKALYARVARHAGAAAREDWSSADVFKNAGNDAVAADTVRYFSLLLGRIAGDVALATGAWGGVYLFGSVVDGWAEVADIAQFRQEFERKGLMTERMHGVFSGIIIPDDAPLIGLMHLDVE